NSQFTLTYFVFRKQLSCIIIYSSKRLPFFGKDFIGLFFTKSKLQIKLLPSKRHHRINIFAFYLVRNRLVYVFRLKKCSINIKYSAHLLKKRNNLCFVILSKNSLILYKGFISIIHIFYDGI